MSPSEMLGKKKLHQMVDTKSPSTFKRVKVDATRNFPENCGSFVCQNNGSKETYLEFPSNTKSVKVDSTRSFPENCGPCVPEKKNGSDTLCSVDSEIKSCSEVDMNVVGSAEPLTVFVPEDDLAATGARPKEAGDSSHQDTSCQPTNGNQQHEVLVNRVLQNPSIDTGNTRDWFIKDELIEPELPAIVSQENLIEARNEPSKETSKRVHYEEVPDDESRSRVDNDEICILSCSESNSLKSGLKTPSAGKKGGKDEIVQEEAVRCPEPLHKCKVIFEDASVVKKKQIDLGVSQEDLRNSAVMCGVSRNGLSTQHEHIQKVKEVRETLKLFDDEYTKLLLEDRAEKHEGRSKRRIHIEAAMALKKQKKWVNCEWTFGDVPGVQIGDQFRFRAELVMIGLHHQFIKGINYVTLGRKDVASSIVDSGRYDNEAISSETFIYVGQGGNPKVSVNERVEDQKLEGGNLALKNSMDLGYPVRVICGRQRVNGEKNDIRYIYDGLYTVTKCWEERAPTGKYSFKFELKRNLGQPKLTRELVSRPAKLQYNKDAGMPSNECFLLLGMERSFNTRGSASIEAENRIDHDEYLFDIGNYDEEIPKRNVAHNNNLKVESNSLMRKDEDGFTLDALIYGNIGRFINHSCSPNLYAENVMYYHGDKRVPHIMFFASESIAPLEELTYHYNYHVDHVSDKNGDMKRKNCRCGSRKCEGRMY
ncbi:hypothetical protein R3W88_008515 [Solanum pinnatisectum]|uniref:SET domain protein n=1 Tax=Solanum pinnatisectum TaxID=50273 RepID=A0AAV9MBE4_9SOLN|nr:hypothetical protein R3W88_008515 [Solanum pinnatisectum]